MNEKIDVTALAHQLKRPSRAQVQEVQDRMKEMKERQIELPIREYQAKGLYAREMTVPAGASFVGRIHKTQHFAVVSKGDITIWTEGEEAKRYQAPCLLICPPGTKRVGHAHSETVWTTFHATDVTDLSKIEDALVVDTFEQFEQFQLEEKACRSQQSLSAPVSASQPESPNPNS